MPPTPSRAESGAVPVWAVRTPPAGPGPDPSSAISPQFHAEVSFDPAALRRRAIFRAGASSVVVDDEHLRLRTWFRRTDIAWADVLGFESRNDTNSARITGHIVVRTINGPVTLRGTRRPMAELREVRALLDAYRIRANAVRSR